MKMMIHNLIIMCHQTMTGFLNKMIKIKGTTNISRPNKEHFYAYIFEGKRSGVDHKANRCKGSEGNMRKKRVLPTSEATC